MSELPWTTTERNARIKANWEEVCASKWRETFTPGMPHYTLQIGQLKKAMTMLTEEERAAIISESDRFGSILKAADLLGIPWAVARYVVKRYRLSLYGQEKATEYDIEEKLCKIEGRLVGELERRTESQGKRVKMSLEEIALALKVTREHLNAGALRNANNPEGSGRTTPVVVKSDWMEEAPVERRMVEVDDLLSPDNRRKKG